MDFHTWRAFEIDAGPAGTFWEVFVDNDADTPGQIFRTLDAVLVEARKNGAVLALFTVDWVLNSYERNFCLANA